MSSLNGIYVNDLFNASGRRAIFAAAIGGFVCLTTKVYSLPRGLYARILKVELIMHVQLHYSCRGY
jgi:hypothetical protein